MKSNYIFKSVAIICLAIFAVQLFAQEKAKDELYLFHQDIIKADMVTEYEAIGKELFGIFKKHGMEGTVKFASKTDDNKYNFLSPLKSYADLDNRSAQWTNLAKKAGKELADIFGRMDETYVSHKDYIIKLSADLSYWPENNRLKDQKAEFLHFDHYYFKESKIDEAMKMMKEFKEMMTKKKSDEGYSVWIFDIGEEYGHVVVTRSAKNAVDYYQTADRRMESMKEEMKEMWPKFSKTLKRFEHNNGQRMPEFIYDPAK